MKYEFLSIEKSDRVVTVRMNRPEKRNALSATLMKELIDVAGHLEDDMAASVVVLVGSNRFFSAGMDLMDRDGLGFSERSVAVRRRRLELGPRMCNAWENLPQVTIVALEGFCIGGAVSLALSCDFRVMAEDAYIRIPEIDLGMNFSWGSLARLVSLVGPAVAKKWVITTEKVNCREAVESGFAQWTAPPGQTGQRAWELAVRIAEKPQAPVFMTKQTVNALCRSNHAVGHMDVDQFALTVLSEDFEEGTAAFLEGRKPIFNKNLPE